MLFRSRNKFHKGDYNKKNNIKSSSSFISPSDCYYKYRNDEIAKDFEENIREILINDYNWEKSDFKREFSYRELRFNETERIIKTNDSITITIDNKEIKFMLDSDNILRITEDGKTEEIKEQNEKIINKNGNKINIGQLKQVEIDGLFKLNNFSVSKFDSTEIKIIYKNVDDITNFKYSVCEIKYSKKNFDELIQQLKKDKNILEKCIRDSNINTIYIGFIRTNNIQEKKLIELTKDLKDIPMLIIGLKEPIFSKRKIDKYIDWGKLIEDKNKFNKLEYDLNCLKNKISEIEDNMNNKINSIEKKLDNKIDEVEKNLETKINNLERLERENKKNIRKLRKSENKIIKNLNKLNTKIDSLFELIKNDNNSHNKRLLGKKRK